MDGLRCRGGGHDPGQVLVDLAVMLADGGEAIARHRRAGRSARPARSGRVAGHGVAGAGRRRRPAAGRVCGGLGRWRGSGPGWPAAESPAGCCRRRGRPGGPGLRGARPGRHPDRGALGEGAGGRRTSRAGSAITRCSCFLDNTNEALAGILRTGQRRVEHRRRPHRRPRPGAGAAARRAPGRADPGPHRRRRVLPRLPAITSSTHGVGVLGRVRGHRRRPRRDHRRAAVGVDRAVDADGGLRDGAQVAEITDAVEVPAAADAAATQATGLLDD